MTLSVGVVASRSRSLPCQLSLYNVHCCSFASWQSHEAVCVRMVPGTPTLAAT